ncbi:MAG: hypothetical protein V4537_14505 [Pseudomonadota bacterium]
MSDVKPEKSPKVEAPAAAKRAVEKIAFDRGMLPEFKQGEPPAHKPKVIMPLIHNPKFVVFARAKAFHGWVTGHEMTDAEFDAATAVSEGQVYR